ncbi:alpha-ketoglutarate-dependent dioxygenase AlkB [Rhizobium sp. EC-SD404]|uniref:alpha-ketoglutarate-dependent dioxygenase AlkB family protein n=1 Tax=Rhizobium sp. EC-SD404 TaxID=2038389 RepID=UPI0012583D99|nr:alpha-ketoglutarate-dependent dioxygenase AlkB [Rhizobium sp. EC-SD404]VVS99462.1 Alpha-ketoglutarate-dependent dioxygenase AlkB homolog [Rhizobium sp. EC-SD404]
MTEASSGRDRIAEGFRYLPAHLTMDNQRALLEDIRLVVAQAPLYVPRMPRTGKALSVRMTNCGDLGWVTDQAGGYRYQPLHPATGRPWPAMPGSLLDLWRDLAGVDFPPEACLVNFYDADARMGLHQDKDEQNLDAPVLSISLGDDCRFRIGGTVRGGSTASLTLNSGDVVVLGGPARLAYHGVDRIYAGTSTLLKNGGRINLTLRRVTPIQTPGTES